MLVAMLLIPVVAWGVQRTGTYRGASRGKRFLLMPVPLFIILMIFNLIWPYNQPARLHSGPEARPDATEGQ